MDPSPGAGSGLGVGLGLSAGLSAGLRLNLGIGAWIRQSKAIHSCNILYGFGFAHLFCVLKYFSTRESSYLTCVARVPISTFNYSVRCILSCLVFAVCALFEFFGPRAVRLGGLYD